MTSIEHINKLTPEFFNTLCNKAIKPRDLNRINKGLGYLEIQSIGHFFCMCKNEMSIIEDQPNLFWKGPFMRHIESERKRVSESFDFIELYRFGIGKWIFINKINEIHVQLYSHFRRSDDPIYRLVATKMFIMQQKISTYTEDYEVIERMTKINDVILNSEFQRNVLKRDIIIATGDFYQYETFLTPIQLKELSIRLTNTKYGLIQEEYIGGLQFILGERISEVSNLEFPIKWNSSGIELMYLFYCLVAFKLMPSEELSKLSDKVSINFVDFEYKKFKPKSLARVSQREKLEQRIVEEIQKVKRGSYQKIYEVVKIVAKSE
jgi:hypothetical protein